MSKKLIWGSMVLLLVVLICHSVSIADSSGKCGPNAYWTLDRNGLLKITGTGKIDVTNNGMLDSYPWKVEDVKTVKIADGITAIGDFTFGSCSNLTSVSIPSSVSSIGMHAFEYCYKITSMTIPEGVRRIETGAFDYCYNLLNINIPKSVNYIGDSAFYRCDKLESFSFPEGITTIGDRIFYSCDNMKSVTIPKSVKTIKDGAFMWCESLTDVFYGGTQEDWNLINISKTGNDVLTVPTAKIHFSLKADSGWTEINGVKYYITSNGTPLTGIQLIEGEYHFFNDDGVWLGLQKDVNGIVRIGGEWVLFKNGEIDRVTRAIVEYNGGRFFVANGAIIQGSGLYYVDSKWYYLAHGQVTDYTGLTEYDGEWFYVNNGIMDTGLEGIIPYDGARFLVGAGRIIREANGLIQDPVTKKWYFVSNGQVQTNYRGLALYDDHWFYIWDGLFLDDAIGWVEHDGNTFYVVNGMLPEN